MNIVQFYRGDPNAPRPTRGAHLGANAILTCQGRILLECRWDCGGWGLPGGGVKAHENEAEAMVRELYEELGLRVRPEKLRKLGVYGEPGRIAAYRDGSVWRMVIVVFGLDLPETPDLTISRESRRLAFFTKEEARDLDIVVTHRDIVEDWFLNR